MTENFENIITLVKSKKMKTFESKRISCVSESTLYGQLRE